MRMKDEGYYTLIEMKDEFSEAGEPVPLRRRPLYPAELRVHIFQAHIIQEAERKVNSKGERKRIVGLHVVTAMI